MLVYNFEILDEEKVLVKSGIITYMFDSFKSLRTFDKLRIRKKDIEKRNKILSLGYDEVIFDNNNILETEENFDKILELVGPASIKDSFSHIKEYGIICATGLLGGKWYLEDFDPTRDIKNNAYLTTFYSGNVNGERINFMLDYIEKYKINVKAEKIFSLDEIVEAHKYLDSSSAFGKVIVINK